MEATGKVSKQFRDPRGGVQRLDVLEDRVLTSVRTATNNLDAGAGWLRATIKAANAGDTIKFASKLAGTVQE